MTRLAQPIAIVVDDDSLFLVAIEKVLKDLNITPVLISNLSQFTSTIRSTRADLFLIDLNLGSFGSGLKLVETIRQEKGPQVPILIFSGSRDEKALAHALECGANDYIVKTFDKEFLAGKLGRLTKSPSLNNRKQALYSEVPKGGHTVQTSFPVEIVAIDELGVKIQSKNLLSKGSTFSIGGPFIEEVTQTSDQFAVTVAQTWTDGEGTFGAYAEFDHTNRQVHHAVRCWLNLMNRVRATQTQTFTTQKPLRIK